MFQNEWILIQSYWHQYSCLQEQVSSLLFPLTRKQTFISHCTCDYIQTASMVPDWNFSTRDYRYPGRFFCALNSKCVCGRDFVRRMICKSVEVAPNTCCALGHILYTSLIDAQTYVRAFGTKIFYNSSINQNVILIAAM